MNKISLSPPWETLQKQFKYTFGLSPCVDVEDLKSIEGGYLLNVNIKNDCIAFALRQIINPVFYFGNINVVVSIKDSRNNIVRISDRPYSISGIKNLFCNAFRYNPLFFGIHIDSNVAFIIFKQRIIQFFNDDISNLCQNYNEIASRIFEDICINRLKINSNPMNISVHYNTYADCMRDKNICCK